MAPADARLVPPGRHGHLFLHAVHFDAGGRPASGEIFDVAPQSSARGTLSFRPFGRHLGVAAALCATLATCRFPTGVDLPASAVAFGAPAVYARWWAMAESCSGVTGSLRDVSFLQVPGVAQFDHNGTSVIGFWTNDGNRIVLAGDAMLDGGNVRHEMLHALIRVGGHPRDQFLSKCAGTVDCGQQCIADAGPAPAADPAALSISPATLEVTAEITPKAPTSNLDGGFFTVTVSVRNPTTTPTIARLGATNQRALAFRYDVSGTMGGVAGGEIVLDASSVTFDAGETKRHVFDFAIGNNIPGNRLPPGLYTMRGGYGSHLTTPVSVPVGP